MSGKITTKKTLKNLVLYISKYLKAVLMYDCLAHAAPPPQCSSGPVTEV